MAVVQWYFGTKNVTEIEIDVNENVMKHRAKIQRLSLRVTNFKLHIKIAFHSKYMSRRMKQSNVFCDITCIFGDSY